MKPGSTRLEVASACGQTKHSSASQRSQLARGFALYFNSTLRVNQVGSDSQLLRSDTNELVCATREQGYQHHQVRQREQPLLRLRSGCFRCPRDDTQMPGTREIVNMFHADARQAGYFRICKDFLARLYRNQKGPHFSPP